MEFPGNHFTGEITPALVELVQNGTIRIIDLLVVQQAARNARGEVVLNERIPHAVVEELVADAQRQLVS